MQPEISNSRCKFTLNERTPIFKLVVWDTQTGVVINEFGTEDHNKVIFHGDQRTITFVTRDLHFYTYDVLHGTQLCHGKILQALSAQMSGKHSFALGAHWTHNDTLLFATSVNTDGESVIIIHELQPTSTPPLHQVSSSPIPAQHGEFSFSPVSFHASFVTDTGVLILNVQDSKVLLQTQVFQSHRAEPGQFAPNGSFYIYGVLGDGIYIWQNTSTGYVPWSLLTPRLSYRGFSWSPTSISILCWGQGGIQLLHPDNCLSPFSPNKVKPRLYGNHLVAYSADQTYIATARKGNSVVTVLDHLSGTPQQYIHTDMQIQYIKIVDNTIFVVDMHKLASWDLEAGRTVNVVCNVGGVTFNEPLNISAHGGRLVLSHDHSQIIFTDGGRISLYNIKASKVITKGGNWSSTLDLQLSSNQHRLWFLEYDTANNPARVSSSDIKPPTSYSYVELEVEDGGFGNVTAEHVGDKWSWVNLFSPLGYHVGEGSQWVADSKGTKLLWLPPNCRMEDLQGMQWNGNFLAMVDYRHPEPMIIEFR